MVVVEKHPFSLAPLIQLCHYRWGAPVVAALWESGGAKFVTLANRLEVSRDALSRTLTGLDALGLVMRNPGYGHPMRPEYLLAPDGETAGPAAHAMVIDVGRMHLSEAAMRKWSLPALAAMRFGDRRFGGVAAALPGVTPRALTQTLVHLERAQLVERRLIEARPVRAEYLLTPSGEAVADRAVQLAKALAMQPEG